MQYFAFASVTMLKWFARRRSSIFSILRSLKGIGIGVRRNQCAITMQRPRFASTKICPKCYFCSSEHSSWPIQPVHICARHVYRRARNRFRLSKCTNVSLEMRAAYIVSSSERTMPNVPKYRPNKYGAFSIH